MCFKIKIDWILKIPSTKILLVPLKCEIVLVIIHLLIFPILLFVYFSLFILFALFLVSIVCFFSSLLYLKIKNKAKRLRATTCVIAKLEKYLFYCNIGKINILIVKQKSFYILGATQIFFCLLYFRYVNEFVFKLGQYKKYV